MEPKKETAIGFQLKELGNKFLEGIHADKDAVRKELNNILKEKFNPDNIATTINNRQGRRNKILNDVRENRLGFKYIAIMLVDNHPLFEGWLDEFKIREFSKILKLKIDDFESGKTDLEIMPKETAVPYREFKENLQKLIPPQPLKEDKSPNPPKKMPGIFDLGKK